MLAAESRPGGSLPRALRDAVSEACPRAAASHLCAPRPTEEMNAERGPALAVTQAGTGERGGLKINYNRRAIKPFGVSQSQHLSPKLLLWDWVPQPGPTMLPFFHQAHALLAGSCTSSSFCQTCVRGFGAAGPPLQGQGHFP